MGETRDYYVYALLDPRDNPARPFYIGKGHGSRKSQHLNEAGESDKLLRIEAIRAAGQEPQVQEMVTGLTESQALLLEAQLIGAFGTLRTGGSLTNQVVPSGMTRSAAKRINVPWGVVERAQAGLTLIRQAVLDLVEANPEGVTNADVASALGIRSHFMGASKDYLSYSLLGLLMNVRQIAKRKSRYFSAGPTPKGPDGA